VSPQGTNPESQKLQQKSTNAQKNMGIEITDTNRRNNGQTTQHIATHTDLNLDSMDFMVEKLNNT